VAPSARTIRAGVAVLIPCWIASGCAVTTTQEKDARLEVKAERTIFNSKRIKLDAPPDGVVLGKPQMISAKGGSAIVVDVSNETDAPINDVPIAVGVRTAKGKEYVNLERGTSYFESHLGSLAAGAETTWVYATKKDLPEGEPFAQLGTPADPPLTVATDLPSVEVSQPGGEAGKDRVAVEVRNDSDVPQYEVQLYAWARDGDELKAAGTGKVAELEGGESATVRLELAGDPDKAEIEVSAPPTIFQ
jgi:hypothetical protein